MARSGYARVSTIDQDLQVQLDRPQCDGCEIVRSEKVSGASPDGRAELATTIEFLRQGDELVVILDRLVRDTRDVLNIVHDCQQRGAFVTAQGPPASTRAVKHGSITTSTQATCGALRTFGSSPTRGMLAHAGLSHHREGVGGPWRKRVDIAAHVETRRTALRLPTFWSPATRR